jgi:hypothetical protein
MVVALLVPSFGFLVPSKPVDRLRCCLARVCVALNSLSPIYGTRKMKNVRQPRRVNVISPTLGPKGPLSPRQIAPAHASDAHE